MDTNKQMMKLKHSGCSGLEAVAWIIIVIGILGGILSFVEQGEVETVFQSIEVFMIGVISAILFGSGVILLALCKIHNVLYYKKNYYEYCEFYSKSNPTNYSQYNNNYPQNNPNATYTQNIQSNQTTAYSQNNYNRR